MYTFVYLDILKFKMRQNTIQIMFTYVYKWLFTFVCLVFR